MNKLANALKRRLPHQLIQVFFKADQAQSDYAWSQLAHLLAAGSVYNQVHGQHQDIAWISGQACLHADTMNTV